MSKTPLPPTRRTNTAAVGFILAAAIFVVDQATKLYVLHRVDLSDGPVALLPFVDITLVWNRGISYGLFQQDGVGRWLLVAVTAIASVALAVWLWRARRMMVAIAVALILGGAVGNLVDRVVYGAVVDFVSMHYGQFSWYVFNVADAAIVVGVIILVADAVFARPQAGASSTSS